jgi:hypothetical protein
MSRRAQDLLSPAIIAIMEGKLRFRRYGQHWKPEGEAAGRPLELKRLACYFCARK